MSHDDIRTISDVTWCRQVPDIRRPVRPAQCRAEKLEVPHVSGRAWQQGCHLGQVVEGVPDGGGQDLALGHVAVSLCGKAARRHADLVGNRYTSVR
jgi:hypothetical protein